MAAYSPTGFTDNEAVTASRLNTEFTAIQTALAIDSNNLAADSVPLNAVANDAADYVMVLTLAGQTTGPVAITTAQVNAPIPFASAKVVSVWASCSAINVAVGPTFDVYLKPATSGSWTSILSAAKAMTAADTGYEGSVVGGSTVRSLGDQLSLRVYLGAADTIDDLTVTIGLKNQHVAY